MVNIEEFLSTEYFRSRQELSKETGLTEREVRNKISKLKYDRPVIYNSYTKGYRLAKDFSLLTREEIEKELELINHSIRDIGSRKKVFDKQLRSYIAYKEAAIKEMNKFIV